MSVTYPVIQIELEQMKHTLKTALYKYNAQMSAAQSLNYIKPLTPTTSAGATCYD